MSHLLVEADGAVLLDAGFPGDQGRIRRGMAKLGLGPRDLKAIVLTHGHIDHAGNAAWAKAWSGAPVYAHPLEQAHIDGTFPYAGLSRVTGVLEAAGRAVTGYRPVPIDVPIADGQELPFWGGLKVVFLPGHTIRTLRVLQCPARSALYRRFVGAVHDANAGVTASLHRCPGAGAGEPAQGAGDRRTLGRAGALRSARRDAVAAAVRGTLCGAGTTETDGLGICRGAAPRAALGFARQKSGGRFLIRKRSAPCRVEVGPPLESQADV